MARGKKILVLIDMNGTVCYRHEEPVAGVRPDLYVRRKYYYKRHGVEQFVKMTELECEFHELVYQPIFESARVYSSMMAHNLHAGLDVLLSRETRGLLRAVLDRDMNKQDPDGENEWDTIRDMAKVWRKLPEYGPRNTILLDNEARKFNEHPDNGIVVPEFGPSEVRNRQPGTLNSVLAYLLRLGEAEPDDVREYLEDHPFVRATLPSAPARTSAARGPPTPATAASSTSALAEALARLAFTSSPAGSSSNSQPAATAAQTPESSSRPLGGHDVTPVHVPEGTRLKFMCIENGHFVLMSSETTDGRFTVRGPVTQGWRIDDKVDYHLLVEEAKQNGCTLTIEHEPKRPA